MKDVVDLEELKDQLREVIPLNSGGSFQMLWDMLYHIRLLKYVRQPQIKLIHKNYEKISADKKLKEYIKLDLLSVSKKNIYSASNKSLQILKQLKYPYKTLPKMISGEGDINEINNTTVFIQALKLPDFKTLLYPRFPDSDRPNLIPDALLVIEREGQYKLEFLEVEASKPNWDNWLEKKRDKYIALAKSREAYDYWKIKAQYLNMPVPDIKDFKFSVTFICKINKDFGPGFTFKDKL